MQELPDHCALAGSGGPDALQVLELVLEREGDPGDRERHLCRRLCRRLRRRQPRLGPEPPVPEYPVSELPGCRLGRTAVDHQRSAPAVPPGCDRPALRPIQATQESTHHAQDAQHRRQQQRIAAKCEPREALEHPQQKWRREPNHDQRDERRDRPGNVMWQRRAPVLQPGQRRDRGNRVQEHQTLSESHF